MDLTSAYYENYDKMIQSAAGREEFLTAAANAIGLPPWHSVHQIHEHGGITTTSNGGGSLSGTTSSRCPTSNTRRIGGVPPPAEDEMVVLVNDYNYCSNLLTDEQVVRAGGAEDDSIMTGDISSCLEEFLLLEDNEQQQGGELQEEELEHPTIHHDLDGGGVENILVEAPLCSSYCLPMRTPSCVIEIDDGDDNENPSKVNRYNDTTTTTIGALLKKDETEEQQDEDDDDLSLLQDALLLPPQDEEECLNRSTSSSWIAQQVSSPMAVKQHHEQEDEEYHTTVVAHAARVTPLPITPVSRMNTMFYYEEDHQHSLCSMEDMEECFLPHQEEDEAEVLVSKKKNGPGATTTPYFPSADVVFSCKNPDEDEGEYHCNQKNNTSTTGTTTTSSSSSTWKVLDFDVALPKKKKPRKTEGMLQELGSPVTTPGTEDATGSAATAFLDLEEEEEEDHEQPAARARPAAPPTSTTTTTAAKTIKKNNRSKFRLDQGVMWSHRYEAAKAYALKHGHCLIPHSHSDKPLAHWAKRQRFQYSLYLQHKVVEGDDQQDDNGGNNAPAGSHMTDERVRLLNEIGFVWDIQSTTWMHHYRELIAFKLEFGSPDVPTNYNVNPKLGNWVKSQRRQYTTGKMTPSRIQMLEQIGFKWKAGGARTLMSIKKKTATSKKHNFVLHKKN